MKLEHAYPNPQCFISILHNHWVGWLPDSDSPTKLNEKQLLALGGILPADDEKLVQDLLTLGFLLNESAEFPKPHTEIVVIPDQSAVNLATACQSTHRVNHHLALRPYKGGFLTYSTQKNCHAVLSPTVAAAMTGGGPTGSTLLEEPGKTDKLIEDLLECRFIIPLKDMERPKVRQNAAVAFARYATSGVALELQGCEPEKVLEGRIPVYFAGCIDLAMDMSYGYLNLALGMIRATAEAYEGGRLKDRFYMVPHFLMTPAAVLAAAETYGPGVVFFSNYIWAHEGNLKASRDIKVLDRKFVCVFGGPQAPNYGKDVKTMHDEHPHVDILVRGEGEITAADLLDKLCWDTVGTPDYDSITDVPGIAYRDATIGDFRRTADRPRLTDLAELPSPYVAGVFDSVPQEILYGATLETNRGCPYGCTFCDWGSATRQKIRRFEMERVKAELDWIGQAGISVLFIADANFGVFKRDIEIAQMIADVAKRYGALKQVVTNYAKNATQNLAEIVRIFARSGLASEGIISIQTRDTDTLHVINRDNIKTERYDELLEVFREERLPLSTDLMIGLPGATPESFKSDLQHYFETGVQAKAYLTRMLVNSPMAEPQYVARHAIETDEQGFMRSCHSYTVAERDYMLDLFGMYSLAVSYGLFKYVLYYLQWDKGIRGIDFIDAFLQEIKSEPQLHPRTSWTLGFLDNQLHSPGGWRPFLEEIASFAERRFGIEWDSAMEAVLQAQEAVLADPDKQADRNYELDHDVVRYYRDNALRMPLIEYGPGTLSVQDVYGVCKMDPVRHYQYDTHSVAWELESQLNDVDRPVFFLEKDQMLAKLSWPQRTAIGQRAW